MVNMNGVKNNMREIKLRVWYEGLMYPYVEHTTYADGSQGVTLLGFGNYDMVCPHSDRPIVVMQYTGLKDKNGREIYEGDILLGNYKKLPKEVKYINACFHVVNPNIRSYALNRAISMIVIGNIYENSYLL